MNSHAAIQPGLVGFTLWEHGDLPTATHNCGAPIGSKRNSADPLWDGAIEIPTAMPTFPTIQIHWGPDSIPGAREEEARGKLHW